MTDPDLLARATSALRDKTRPHDEGMDEALLRLRWASRRRPRRFHKFGAPLLAAALGFGGAVAWASAAGHLQQWVESIVEYGIWPRPEASQGVAIPDAVRPDAVRPDAVRPDAVRPDAVRPDAVRPDAQQARESEAVAPDPTIATDPIATDPTTPTGAAPAAPTGARPGEVPTRGPTASDITPTSRTPESASREMMGADVAYRRAHRLHFARKDYAAALAAWNDYLSIAPAGEQWLPEARFNRAVALHRLGRGGEARHALEPFARGVYGGYRRDEAKRLLEQLPLSDKP